MSTHKVWFITGCATGFGALLAQAAHARGDAVVATDRSLAALAHLGDPGERLALLELDVTDAQAAVGGARAAIERFGRVDVLVNNAGLGIGGPFEELEAADIQRVVAVNALGPMFVTGPLLGPMRAQGGGSIINISSDSGVVGWPFQSVYCASKHALEGFAESLAHEVAPFGIRVSLIEPCGFFRTPMPGGALAEAARRNQPASAYYERIAGMASAMEPMLEQGSDPAMVVAAILAVADDPRPPMRLPVGPTERVAFVRMRQAMADEEYVQLIRRNA